MSGMNDDNQGKPLSAQKWRNVDDVIDKMKLRVVGNKMINKDTLK